MNINILIFESAVRRRRFRFFETKNLFNFREFTSSFDVSHNAFSRTSDYSDYDIHSLVFFCTIFSKQRLIDCIIYNSLMNMFRRQIIAFVAKMTIILKCSRIVEYWINLSMIFTTIAFDDITSTFVHLIKSTFVKMNLNHHFNNTSRSSHQKKR